MSAHGAAWYLHSPSRRFDYIDSRLICSLDGLLYYPEIRYRRRLNQAFGPGGWGLAPRGDTHVTKNMVTREWGLVCLGR